MTRSEAKNVLLKEFITEYAEATPVAYTNNENFTKPSNSSWVRFSIQNNDSFQATLGIAPVRRFERLGLITAQVFIPVNTGTYEGDILCESIINIFEGKRFGIIVCGTGVYSETGVTETDWFQFNIIIPYDFDQKK